MSCHGHGGVIGEAVEIRVFCQSVHSDKFVEHASVRRHQIHLEPFTQQALEHHPENDGTAAEVVVKMKTNDALHFL